METIDNVLCNARLKQRPSDGPERVTQIGENILGSIGWVTGRLTVTEEGVWFSGKEIIISRNELAAPSRQFSSVVFEHDIRIR